jgi:hypothetical protein
MEKPIGNHIAEHIAKRIAKFIAIAIAGIIAIVLFIFLGGKVVQLLWNWLMPMLFGLREVTFWQAVGILALSRILFGGFGMGGGRSRGRWDRHMSAEERARLRQRMHDRCGDDPAPGEIRAQ